MNLELENDINRYIEKQKEDYDKALKEIKNGKKQSCWMWFIFPQLRGLGTSTISSYYGIKDLDEGIQYLNNEILRNNLIEITKALLDLGEVDIREVMGFIDDIKLKSSMTFFNIVEKESGINCGGIFNKVLIQFFKGEEDENTYNILKKQKLEKEKKNEINEKDKDKLDTIDTENAQKFIGKKTKENKEIIENEEKENDNKDKGKVKEKEEKEKENKEKEQKEKEEKEKENKEKEQKEKEDKGKEEKEKEEKETENKEKEQKEKEEKENKEKEEETIKEKENKGKKLKNSENEYLKEKIENKGDDDSIEDQYEKISYNENKLPLKSPKMNKSLKKVKNENNGTDKLSLHKNEKNINEQNKNKMNDEEIILKNYGDYKIKRKKETEQNNDISIQLKKVEIRENKCCDINCNII